MEKPQIIGIQNYEDVHRYVIRKQPEIHGQFCNLFSELGFSEENVGKVDLTFDNMDEDYIYIKDKKAEVHLFFTAANVHMVIKTDLKQTGLNAHISKFFRLPSQNEP